MFKPARLVSMEIYKNPSLFPINLSLKNNTITFVEIPTEKLEAKAFHDYRILRKKDIFSVNIDIDQFADFYLANNVVNTKQVNSIFHSAFCGSTLLSRYLALSGSVFAYREPTAFSELAKNKIMSFSEPEAKDRWLRAFKVITSLFSRTVNPDDSVIIKHHDGCNNLIDECSNDSNYGPCTFLYSNLESFLLSCLKSDRRVEWARGRLKYELTKQSNNFSHVDINDLDVPKIIACLWTRQMHTLSNALRNKKLLPINCQSLYNSPKNTIKRVASHLGLSLKDNDIERSINQLRGKHSKNNTLYTLAENKEINERLSKKLSGEINDGVNWSRRFVETNKITLPSSPDYS